jgi:hypothetical protein
LDNKPKPSLNNWWIGELVREEAACRAGVHGLAFVLGIDHELDEQRFA